MEAYCKALGARLKAARERAGFTQEELGEKIGLTGKAVYSWERGKTAPRAFDVYNLTQTLNVSADYLVIGVVE